MESKIDFVILWVDGSDPEWIKEKEKYSSVTGDKKINRYRDWDNLKYWFRGVEAFAPWVNNIFFVTWGHIPEWLNTNNPKLKIVNHKDYIPEKYLPTFSANPIELNLHRIKELSENFVFFNDDMFLIKKVEEDDFFHDGMPCDNGILSPVFSLSSDGFAKLIMNDMYIINKYFDKNKVIKENFFKWFNLKYGKHVIKNVYLNSWERFAGFYDAHTANSFKKSTFEKVWEKEPELLDKVSSNKFRNVNEDVNQFLVKYWQLCEGNFYPRKITFSKYFEYSDNNESIYENIRNQRCSVICLNDVVGNYDFEQEKKNTIDAFEEILPNKSSFEK